jgi:hypothetical protein
MTQLVMRLTLGVEVEDIDVQPNEITAGVSWYVWTPPEPERADLNPLALIRAALADIPQQRVELPEGVAY